MGVADLFVKSHPRNFVKCFIFYICLNVITIVFWISKSFQIYKFLNPTSYPVLELSLLYDIRMAHFTTTYYYNFKNCALNFNF